MNNLSHLKALALAATPGEWSYYRSLIGKAGQWGIESLSADEKVFYPTNMEEPDAAFIAAANPKAVLELIEVMEMMASALKLIKRGDWNEILKHGNTRMNEALARYEALTQPSPKEPKPSE